MTKEKRIIISLDSLQNWQESFANSLMKGAAADISSCVIKNNKRIANGEVCTDEVREILMSDIKEQLHNWRGRNSYDSTARAFEDYRASLTRNWSTSEEFIIAVYNECEEIHSALENLEHNLNIATDSLKKIQLTGGYENLKAVYARGVEVEKAIDKLSGILRDLPSRRE